MEEETQGNLCERSRRSDRSMDTDHVHGRFNAGSRRNGAVLGSGLLQTIGIQQSSKRMPESRRKHNLSDKLNRMTEKISQCAVILILIAILLLTSPTRSNADIKQYNVVTDEFYGLNAERILLVPSANEADKTVVMVGKCSSRGATDLYLEASPENAKQRWFVVSQKEKVESDQEICLTGNLPSWFEKVSLSQ